MTRGVCEDLGMNGPQTSGDALEWQVLEPALIARHASEWDGLVVQRGYPAFMRTGFIGHAIDTFGCPKGRLVLGRMSGQLVVGALVVSTGWGRWASYQPSQLPLGAWIMATGYRWEDVLPSLSRNLPGYPISLSVTQQDPLFTEHPGSDPRLEVLDYVSTGWIDVTGSYDEFWQSRGKNLRQNLRKQRRRLEEQGHRLRFDFLESAAAVDAALLEFSVLESAGWKAALGTAIAPDNAQGDFYRNMLADAAAAGRAFACRLTLDDKPVAVDFGLRDSNSLVILKTTYDETFKGCSPAQLLHEQAFECIFQRRLARTVEFYGKLMEWHSRWTDKSRTLYHVNFFRTPAWRKLRMALQNRRSRRHAAAVMATTE